MNRRWLRIGCLVVGSLLLLWLASRAVATWHVEAVLRKARNETAAGQFQTARRRLVALSRSSLANPEAAFLLGVCEYEEGNLAAALASWSRVPEGSPFAARASLAGAQTLVGDFGRFADAEPLLRSAMNGRDATAVEARHALFQLFFWQGRIEEMRPLIEEAWQWMPDRAAELRDHWRLDSAIVDRDGIRSAVEDATRKAPDDDRVWLARAYLATLNGQPGEAHRWLVACLNRRPDDPAVWRAWLRWARQGDRVPEVRQALKHLPADQRSAAEALDLRAWFAAHAGDRETERLALNALVEIDPGNTQALSRLILLETAQPVSEERLADLRRRKVAADQARERYRRLLEDNETDPDFEQLALQAETLGRWFEARGWWTLAVVRSPASPAARAGLSRARSRPEPPQPPPGQTLADLVNRE